MGPMDLKLRTNIEPMGESQFFGIMFDELLIQCLINRTISVFNMKYIHMLKTQGSYIYDSSSFSDGVWL